MNRNDANGSGYFRFDDYGQVSGFAISWGGSGTGRADRYIASEGYFNVGVTARNVEAYIFAEALASAGRLGVVAAPELGRLPSLGDPNSGGEPAIGVLRGVTIEETKSSNFWLQERIDEWYQRQGELSKIDLEGSPGEIFGGLIDWSSFLDDGALVKFKGDKPYNLQRDILLNIPFSATPSGRDVYQSKTYSVNSIKFSYVIAGTSMINDASRVRMYDIFDVRVGHYKLDGDLS